MSNSIPLTYDLAMAAGRDAANRSMRRNGRTTWNQEDYQAAVQTFALLQAKAEQARECDDPACSCHEERKR